MSDRMIKSLYRTIEMKEALIKQFKARIAELDAMQKQMMNGCDGHCALDECVCEPDQRVVDLQDHVKELEELNAAMSGALETHRDAVWGDTPVAHNEDIELYKALTLTPAYAVERARKKDELINKMFEALRYYNTFFGTDPAAIYAFEAIEAARSAGVEVKDVAL